MSEAIQTDSGLQTRQILRAASEVGVMGGRGHAAQRVLGVLSDPASTAGEIGKVIMREPALAARVLRVANSAMYGQARSISSIERAIVLLGLEAVRGIAAAACFSRSVPLVRKLSGMELDAMHRHSLAVALTSQMLARRCQPSLSADAFMAGLLHDLGVAVQLRLDELRKLQAANGIAAEDVEIFAVDHESCTRIILEEWGFPDALVAAAGHHHAPASAPAPYRTIAAIVHVAECLVQATGLAVFAADLSSHEPTAASLDLLGLTKADLEGLADGLDERINLMIEVFEGASAV